MLADVLDRLDQRQHAQVYRTVFCNIDHPIHVELFRQADIYGLVDAVDTSNGSVANVVQADKAASIPLSLMARSRAGSKMEVSSVVLAAEAK